MEIKYPIKGISEFRKKILNLNNQKINTLTKNWERIWTLHQSGCKDGK